jgi:predicted cobalt transporter CbtA
MAATDTIIGNIVTHIINPLIGVVFALGFALFLWGVVVNIFKLGSTADYKDGRNHMLWGLIGMLIMVAVGGIINMIRGTLGL